MSRHKTRTILRSLAPPYLWYGLVRLRHFFRDRNGESAGQTFAFHEWEYVPDGWSYQQTQDKVRGWDGPEILEVYKRKWPDFITALQRTGPLAVAHESDSIITDIFAHNAVMSFGYVVGRVAQESSSFRMLDWGGGIGHYYLLAKALFPSADIEYHSKDLPAMVGFGPEVLPEQHFHSDESCLENSYDLVMAGTSLHYVEDWKRLLGRLAGATRRYLYVAQLPIVDNVPSFVFVQRPYSYGYSTEYLGWCLNRNEFLRHAQEVGLELIREFIYGYRPVIHRAPEQNDYRGFLFCPRSSVTRSAL